MSSSVPSRSVKTGWLEWFQTSQFLLKLTDDQADQCKVQELDIIPAPTASDEHEAVRFCPKMEANANGWTQGTEPASDRWWYRSHFILTKSIHWHLGLKMSWLQCHYTVFFLATAVTDRGNLSIARGNKGIYDTEEIGVKFPRSSIKLSNPGYTLPPLRK